ncbi:MAG: carbon monoxide dehydrogenase, partial [Mesorhizobium sp.]
ALKEGEIVTAVSFTAPAKAAYQKFRNPASRYAIVGVFVSKGKDGVRAAVTGAGEDGVFRSKEVEAALAKSFDAAALDGLKVPAKGLMS